jgi:hypothetical protein
MVSCTSKKDTVAVLSTEHDGQMGQGEELRVPIYFETPLCAISRGGLVGAERVFTQLAMAQDSVDPNGWTLLHYAAANFFCGADPDEKANGGQSEIKGSLPRFNSS